jgi:hypothetical protein
VSPLAVTFEVPVVMRLSRVLLAIATIWLYADESRASIFDFGEYLRFAFDGVATLGLIISGSAIFLGYRLLVKGVQNSKRGRNADLEITFRFFRVVLTNATPGIIFAVLGCIGIVMSLSRWSH